MTDVLRQVRLHASDTARIEARADLHLAAHRVDLPYDPPTSRHEMLVALEHPLPGADHEYWVAYEGDLLVGSTTIDLPTLDNLDNAAVHVTVHPDHRRRGLGRQLAAHGLDRARANGRRRTITEAVEDGPGFTVEDRGGVALLRALGAQRALAEVRRRADLSSADWSAVEGLRASAETSSPDYRIVRWSTWVPDDVVDGVATLESRMGLDAPMGELEWEAEQYDAKRWRALETAVAARGGRAYGCAAIHATSGVVAGYTMCSIDLDVPEHAWQWTTIVLPDHRGHRLGLRLKAELHLHLREHEPELRAIDTWNAHENTWMIAVNELLGFEVVDTWAEWQLDLAPTSEDTAG